MRDRNQMIRMVMAALFLALCYVFPFLTGQVPEIGAMLCPMHLPVLLCGFICGAPWGVAVGISAPLLRSLTLGMPPLYPTAVCMALELAVYGGVCGLLHRILPRRPTYLYLSLLAAMIAGRIAWGCAMFVCIGLGGGRFPFPAFLAGAVTNALPGIVIQIILIPTTVMRVEKKRCCGGDTKETRENL